MTTAADVWVLGAGFAGRAAVAAARSNGAAVQWTAHAPGATMFWSGLGDVHGPTAPWPAAQSPHRLQREPIVPQAPVFEADARRALLAAALPDHPFDRSGTPPMDVAARVEAAAAQLGLSWAPNPTPSWYLTDASTLRLADGHTEGICRLERGVRYAVVGWRGYGGFDAAWCAATAQAAGFDVVARELASDAAPASTLAGLQASGAAAALAERGALAALAVDAIDRVLVPPWFSRDPSRARAERLAWSDALGRPVFELAGTVDSPFGARALSTSTGADALRSPRVSDCTPRFESGLWHGGDLPARALVLATGGPLSAPSFAASWSGPALPLAEASARSPWRPQAFLASGVVVDRTLRSVLAPGPCWVAGAALAGHDPAHDGTGLGTALWSGAVAGDAASAHARGGR